PSPRPASSLSTNCARVCDSAATTSSHGAVARWPLLGELDRALLADDRHLDLARVLELLLDVAGDLVREQLRLVVVDLLGLDDHPDLAPCLQGVDALDSLPLARELLERLEPLDVRLQALAPRARARRGDRVGGDQQDSLDRLRLHLVVVRLDRVDNRL